MTERQIRKLLETVQNGDTPIDDALESLKNLPYQDIGHTKIDHHRPLRNGFPEVIYAEGKTPQQVKDIFAAMISDSNVLATRVSDETAKQVCTLSPQIKHNSLARTLTYRKAPIPCRSGNIIIVTAGTSDLPVAQEAQVTAEMLGNQTKLISDVGVAGIHRLFASIETIKTASVIIVVAGMEGALASVIGGMVDIPLIAVPTSVGYGAGFGGIAALLGMLTSCAAGISVVNIDNGFGAACAANRINRQMDSKHSV